MATKGGQAKKDQFEVEVADGEQTMEMHIKCGNWAVGVTCEVRLGSEPLHLRTPRALQGLRPSKHTNNVVKGKHNNELIVLPECHNECESHYAQCFSNQ